MQKNTGELLISIVNGAGLLFASGSLDSKIPGDLGQGMESQRRTCVGGIWTRGRT